MSNRIIEVIFEDNNNHISVIIDGEKEECSEMFFSNETGYEVECGLQNFDDDQEVSDIVAKKLIELNEEHGFKIYSNLKSKPSSQKQLLWDALSALSKGNPSETQNVIERLTEHFTGKDISKLYIENQKRYPSA